MLAYQAGIAKFEGSDTQVFGISEDFTPSQKEFAEKNKLTFPLLSDFSKRKVAQDRYEDLTNHPSKYKKELGNKYLSEVATAKAEQQALARVGIKLTIKGFPTGDYFKLYAGKPDYAKSNDLGIMMNG